MAYRYISILILSLLTVVKASAQLEGTVLDNNGSPIELCNVIILQKKNGLLVDFNQTDSLGRFAMKKKMTYKGMMLTTSFIGYITDTTDLDVLDSDRIVIKLKEASYRLSEVTIKSAIFEKKGDTLIYDVRALKEPSDMAVESVLSRIPGVYIKDNGEVLYHNLPINSLNVNGKNLVGGQHNLITKNLHPDNLKNIEIIERHQFIKVLVGREENARATININTKDNKELSGRAELESGLKYPLWKGFGNIMNFGRQFQTITLLSSNNLGYQVGDQFNDFENRVTSSSQFGITMPNIHPFFKNTSTRFGEELVGGFKLLLSKSNLNVQLGASANSDRIKLEGSEIETLRGINESYMFDKKIAIRNNYDDIKTQIKLELNAPSMYIISNNFLTINNNTAFAANQVNGLHINENIKSSDIKFSNKSLYIVKIFNSLLKFNSEIEYEKNNGNLQFTPSDFKWQNEAYFFNASRQNLNLTKWNNALFTKVLRGKIDKNISFLMGYKFNKNSLSSNLLAEDNSANFNAINGFQNEGNFVNHSLYNDIAANITLNKFKFNFDLPLRFSAISLQDKFSTVANNSYNLFILKPKTTIIYKMNDGFEPKVHAQFSNEPSLPDLVYNNPILSRFRQIGVGSTYLLVQNKADLQLDLPYANFENFWDLNFSAEIFRISRNYNTDLSISDLGQSSNLVDGVKNTYWHRSFQLTFNKDVLERKIDIKVRIRHEITMQNFLQSGSLINYNESQSSASLHFKKRTSKLNLISTNEIRSVSNNYLKSNYNVLINKLFSNYNINKKSFISIQFALSNLFSSNLDNQMFNEMELYYNIKHNKLNWRVGLTNPLNYSNANFLTQSGFIFTTYSTILRPRQFTAQFEYKF